MDKSALTATAQAMMQTGKGILAMDESTGTCNKRFAKLNIPQTMEARRDWRELILTTPGLGEFISGFRTLHVRAKEMWDAAGGRFVRSRVAGHFVPVPR